MVKVAILGLGVVGSGVYEVLTKNAESITHKIGRHIEVSYILDRRDFSNTSFSHLVTMDFQKIIDDPEIRVVVECMGGTGAALDFTRRALLAGKHVVTSNKELVAEYGYELLSIAKERNLNYLFEASVGGGIPIIRPLTQCLAANQLTEICGILNGTTNYILTKMSREGLDFDTVLKEAQEKGYAEADPTADIEGHDSCRKICILSDLIFDRHIAPGLVRTEGITGVSGEDIKAAGASGMRIKLLGRSFKAENGMIYVYVAPHLVKEDNQLANVEDVFNGILVKGDVIGDVMFYGRGAGKMPTASAVVADIIDAVKHFEARKYLGWGPAVEGSLGDVDELETRWYGRSAETAGAAEAAFGELEIIKTDSGCSFITGPMSGHEAANRRESCPLLSLIRILD